MRLRHLSGSGTAANNTAFTTSSGTDGWIGVYLKTSNPGFTAQIYLEGASNNGSIERSVNADGNWHLYEWNLDDTAGDANGWGAITGIIAGVAAVADGSHTIDSIIFRNTSFQSSTILMDFVAKSDSGSVAALIPEPGMMSLAGLALLGLVRRGRRA
jgi:MYXO-CTERM domain-containing protein